MNYSKKIKNLEKELNICKKEYELINEKICKKNDLILKLKKKEFDRVKENLTWSEVLTPSMAENVFTYSFLINKVKNESKGSFYVGSHWIDTNQISLSLSILKDENQNERIKNIKAFLKELEPSVKPIPLGKIFKLKNKKDNVREMKIFYIQQNQTIDNFDYSLVKIEDKWNVSKTSYINNEVSFLLEDTTIDKALKYIGKHLAY